MSSKVPKWIVLFQFQSQSQCQSQTSQETDLSEFEEGVSKEAEVWIVDGPKTGRKKRNGKFAAHKKRYEGRFVRRHAHWHKRAEEAHQAKRVQTDGGAFKIKSRILADTKVRESEEEIGGDESQLGEGIKIVAATSKTKSELQDNDRAPQAENVSEVDEYEIKMWSRFKTTSGLLGAAEGLEVEQATEIDEPEFKLWANVVNPTCKTKSELSDDANAPKAEQVRKPTSGTTSELSDGKNACDEVCGEAYDYLLSSYLFSSNSCT